MGVRVGWVSLVVASKSAVSGKPSGVVIVVSK